MHRGSQIVESGEGGATGGGLDDECQPHGGHGRERALGPTQEVCDRIPRVVLCETAQPRDHRPIRQCVLESDDLASHRAESEHPHAAGIGRDHAADGRGVARSEIDGETPPRAIEVCSQLRERDARTHGDRTGLRIERSDETKSFRRQDDGAVSGRHRGADEARVPSLNHHRNTTIRTDAQHRRDL